MTPEPRTWPENFILDGLQWEAKISDLGSELCGECDGDQCQVKIASRLNNEMREQTWWHELIHAIFATRDFPERKFDEEEIAEMLGPALYAFFRANADIQWRPPSET